ncbi:MAG: CBS domain-containing protein [Ruminococcus flavefaciens]|nr:CBS domain-containing protein [Roseburia sp.]MCM1231450.1 CBS domain-containing protein [Ruminococcus flavefaciens]
MYKQYLEDFVINENESAYKACWQLQRNHGALLVVVDDSKKYKGIVGLREIEKSFLEDELLFVKDICNCNGVKLVCKEGEDFYAKGRDIFAEKDISYIPIIDSEKNIIDLFSRKRAFFKEAYRSGNLQRMVYARNIMKTAEIAREIGIKEFSVIEFGVAGGNGLVAAEFYAREISRLLDLKIEVYGFDNAAGLPELREDYIEKEIPYYFYGGRYNYMDTEKLNKRLRTASLIIGDIEETLNKFIEIYHPAPIGFISVDVDQYAGTAAILSFLESDDKNFLPRMNIYFDDINPASDSRGEHRAVLEFNQRNTDMKILPEGSGTKEKMCFRYRHPLYAKEVKGDETVCAYSYYTI